MEKSKRKGFTLVELLVVIVIIGILASLLLPAVARALKQAKAANCASNMRSLWQTMYNYMNQYGGSNKVMPTDSGSAFWLRLTKTPKPLIEKIDIFFCPVAANEITADATDFRGPNGNVNKFDEKDPVGADKNQPENNHGANEGGNVLLKLGSVQQYQEDDPTWIAADSKTTN